MKYATIPEVKDLKRLDDIKTKSAGNIEKAISLATSMANKITDRDKASRRKYAADKYFGEDSKVSKVFENRHTELNPNNIKKSLLIDKILEAFDYKNGCITDLDTKAKIELDIGDIITTVRYFVPRQIGDTGYIAISDIWKIPLLFKKLPELEIMLHENVFSCKRIELNDYTTYEFIL